ncbi:MAG: putative lipid II flippase FtsW [Oscillospiraceae bacterium]|jgi:cell division protein FtsW|nr:putative lipid II flippase FtsW [Oscillospiraceae bacterium]
MPDNVKSKIANSRLRRFEKRKGLFTVGMGLDLPFLTLMFVILVVGLIMMFSASYAIAYYETGDSYFYLFSQLKFAGLGLVGMLALSFFNYRQLHKLAMPILLIAYIALIAVLILPGQDGGTVKRWLPLGFVDIQPSEIAKFALILFLAHYGSKYLNKMQSIKYGVLPQVVLMGSMGGLLVLEPHFSCMAIIALLTVVMMFVSGTDWRWIVGGIVAMVAAVLLIWMFAPDVLSYAQSRLDGWGMALNPDADRDAVWQTRNSIYAIGSGGFWGLGLGGSRQKYLYLPEPQNDFIFAIVCEELGMIGAVLILILFAVFVWRGMIISLKADDKFGKLLGIGLMSQIGLQVIMNVLVITDLMPNTGISLPFFSYGGSSLIMLMLQMGLVLSISRTSNIEK